MLRAILFDLDHTLYDREATLWKMAGPMRDALGIPEDVGQVADALMEGETRFYLEDYSFGGARSVYPVLAFQLSMPNFEAYNDFVNTRLADFVVPYPWAIPMLDKLRSWNLKVGLVTNGKRPMQEAKVRTLGLTPYIDSLVCLDDVGILKPDPAIFHACLGAVGAAPDEAIYVGDNPIDDISGAAGAGMRSIWIKGPHPYPASLPKPTHTVTSAEHIVPIIEALL